MKALVIFSSKNDSGVGAPIVAQLRKSGFEVHFETVSAHRQPFRLDHVLTTSTFDIVIAGAGMAAHLPGVVASKTLMPVIGVPVSTYFAGMDALMNILQIPPGIPVLTVPPMNAKSSGPLWTELARLSTTIDQLHFDPSRDLICFVGDKKTVINDESKKARAILESAGISWAYDKKPRAGVVNIFPLSKGSAPKGLKIPRDCVPIFVPVFSKKDLARAESAVTLIKNISNAKVKGFWVGANNFTNAVCGALQLYNSGGRYNALLTRVKKGEFNA
jgi:5-(carboxyamino)imidazole ribonucleotide mutase